jgi:hypothetical protein
MNAQRTLAEVRDAIAQRMAEVGFPTLALPREEQLALIRRLGADSFNPYLIIELALDGDRDEGLALLREFQEQFCDFSAVQLWPYWAQLREQRGLATDPTATAIITQIEGSLAVACVNQGWRIGVVEEALVWKNVFGERRRVNQPQVVVRDRRGIAQHIYPVSYGQTYVRDYEFPHEGDVVMFQPAKGVVLGTSGKVTAVTFRLLLAAPRKR